MDPTTALLYLETLSLYHNFYSKTHVHQLFDENPDWKKKKNQRKKERYIPCFGKWGTTLIASDIALILGSPCKPFSSANIVFCESWISGEWRNVIGNKRWWWVVGHFKSSSECPIYKWIQHDNMYFDDKKYR